MAEDRHNARRRERPLSRPLTASGVWRRPEGMPFTSPASATDQTREPAWAAAQALQAVRGSELRTVTQHPTFRPPPSDALLPVDWCQICQRGTLHVAGSICNSLGVLVARVCDVCGLVDFDSRLDRYR